MTATLEQLKASAMALPPAERLELISFLQESDGEGWEPTDEFLDTLKRREREMLNGEVEVISREEVRRRIRSTS
mgnify:CR=1 FL=1